MRTTTLAMMSIIGAVAAGCGGDTASPTALPGQAQSPAQPAASTAVPEGLYAGMTGTGRSVTGLVLDDGSYYVIYSVAHNPGVIAGAVQGTGTALNGNFSSTNGKDINIEGLGVLEATVSVSYVSKASLNGNVTYPSLNQTVAFTSTYDSKYEIVPSMPTIAGTYTGRAGSPAGGENATLTITPLGVVTGYGASGCTFAGAIAPRAKGNVYNAAITFGGAPCLYPRETFMGGAYYDGATKRLYAVGLPLTRDTGFIFSGTKP